MFFEGTAEELDEQIKNYFKRRTKTDIQKDIESILTDGEENENCA